jgi:hypothetical protein
VDSVKALGVNHNNRFSVSTHVDITLASCAKSIYALRTLRAHGMSDTALQTVFKSVALAKIMYAASAWHGFTTASDRDRIDAFLRRSSRARFYAKTEPLFSKLCSKADDRLFKSMANNTEHVLHRLLPRRVQRKYDMRARRHPLEPRAWVTVTLYCAVRMLYAP